MTNKCACVCACVLVCARQCVNAHALARARPRTQIGFLTAVRRNPHWLRTHACVRLRVGACVRACVRGGRTGMGRWVGLGWVLGAERNSKRFDPVCRRYSIIENTNFCDGTSPSFPTGALFFFGACMHTHATHARTCTEVRAQARTQAWRAQVREWAVSPKRCTEGIRREQGLLHTRRALCHLQRPPHMCARMCVRKPAPSASRTYGSW